MCGRYQRGGWALIVRCDISAPQPALTLALLQERSSCHFAERSAPTGSAPTGSGAPVFRKVQRQAGSKGAEAGRQNAACAAPLPGGRDDQQRRARLGYGGVHG